MRWPQDAQNWPLSAHSRQVLCRPHRWHVQEAGEGPSLLLIHGAGGATQSWRGIFPPLVNAGYHCVAMDLPGQGFTQLGARQRCGLDHMAEDLRTLCRQEGWRPSAIICHSAGVAIALRLAELGVLPKGQIIGINAALGTFKGVAGWLFPMLAKVLAINPLTASVVSGTATAHTVKRLIEGTGSTLDQTGQDLYLRLIKDRAHVDGTLAMMAQWKLDGLLARLSTIETPTTLITGITDGAVPFQTSHEAAAHLPNCRVIDLPNLGHLAHEEDADQVAELILNALAIEKGPQTEPRPFES